MSDPLGGLAPEEPRAPLPSAPVQKPKRPFTPTTWAILGVLAVAFAAEGFVGHDSAVQSSVALLRSYAFLHIGWMHIAMNGWALWILAPQLEMTYGSNSTMGLFAATAMAGGGASILWAALRGGQPIMSAGASGGLFGLFGATVALSWRLRLRIPPDARKSVLRRILLTLAINVAIAASFPVDSAAHLGGLVCGGALGLIAGLPSLPSRPWHRATQWALVGSALLLAAMEGAAFARAVKPKPRTLRAAGVEAQVPGLFIPLEPGTAGIRGEAMLQISRWDDPLQIQPGDDAVRIGDRTWVRQRAEKDGTEVLRLATAEGSGRLLIELWCGSDFCRGPRADPITEQVARTIHAR